MGMRAALEKKAIQAVWPHRSPAQECAGDPAFSWRAGQSQEIMDAAPVNL